MVPRTRRAPRAVPPPAQRPCAQTGPCDLKCGGTHANKSGGCMLDPRVLRTPLQTPLLVAPPINPGTLRQAGKRLFAYPKSTRFLPLPGRLPSLSSRGSTKLRFSSAASTRPASRCEGRRALAMPGGSAVQARRQCWGPVRACGACHCKFLKSMAASVMGRSSCQRNHWHVACPCSACSNLHCSPDSSATRWWAKPLQTAKDSERSAGLPASDCGCWE